MFNFYISALFILAVLAMGVAIAKQAFHMSHETRAWMKWSLIGLTISFIFLLELAIWGMVPTGLKIILSQIAASISFWLFSDRRLKC